MAGLMAFVLILCAAPARALTTAEHSFDELVALSEQILVGTVTDIASAWGQGREAGTIFSTIRLNAIETIKGPAPDGAYTLKVIGGVVGDQAQFYPGLPQFQSGQRYLLFIRGNRRAMFPITGVTQGFYRVQWDSRAERLLAVPANGGGSVALGRSLHGHADQGRGRPLQGLISDIRASMVRGE
jgi:hypothetical protein